MAHFASAKRITLEGAKAIGAAAEAEAVKNGWTICVAVVDAGGHPLYLARMDGALLASYRGALQKAVTALQFGRPTQRLDDAVAGGRPHVLGFSEVLPVVGGLPIEVDGQVIGGIGIGGTTTGPAATQCAEAGMAALHDGAAR
jgi:glc operon protein GlcG